MFWELDLGPLLASTVGSFEKRSVIYCRKGLHLAYFQGSVTCLWYLLIITFSQLVVLRYILRYCYNSQIICVRIIILYWDLRCMIWDEMYELRCMIRMTYVNCEKSLAIALWYQKVNLLNMWWEEGFLWKCRFYLFAFLWYQINHEYQWIETRVMGHYFILSILLFDK